MTRLKVHHMSEGGAHQATIASKCGISLRSVERILTEPAPTITEVSVGKATHARRRGRPPKASVEVIERVRALLTEEPTLPGTEVHRRSIAWGYAGKRSAMLSLVKQLRPAPKREPVVRFEGLPGEYTQFDFGEARVQYADGKKDKLVFWAARLKFSRFMHVVVVPDQRSETLVRSLIRSLTAFGGSSKEWVFDNPKTVRVSPIGVEPVVLHEHLRALVAEYRVIPTLCAPRSGNQKGSVERLVKYVKYSFFFARKFRDRADVEAQLVAWLHEVNHERPSDATGVIPGVALEEEVRWLAERPVRTRAEDHALRETLTVTPTGTISYGGTLYFASATRIGAPATLFVRQHEVEIVVGDTRVVHKRKDGSKVLQMLPDQNEQLLAAVHGRRKKATARREALLRLGRPAWAFLTQLVHRHPDGRWEKPCEELYNLMVEHGEDPMLAAFVHCNRQHSHTVADVVAALREAA